MRPRRKDGKLVMSRDEQRELRRFARDHLWGLGSWVPRKMRRIRNTPEQVEELSKLADFYLEAARKRFVARGLHQYSKPGEWGYDNFQLWQETRNQTMDAGKPMPNYRTPHTGGYTLWTPNGPARYADPERVRRAGGR